MDEVEAMLRPDKDGIGRLDTVGTLPGVLSAGQRKRRVRRAGRAGFVVAAVAAVAVTVPSGLPGLTVSDVAGTGEAPTSTTPSPSPAHASPEPAPTSEAVSAQQPVTVTPTEGAATPTAAPTSTPTAPPRVPLALTVTTDADSYAQGAPVTIRVRACNRTDRDHDEWFADPQWRFRVQVITADDRNIAFGEHRRDDASPTESWRPGQCRDFTIVWDQTEGPFEEDGGQQAWEGEHRIELSWWGVAPPPDDMDPGLYDPVPRESVWSAVFVIEPPVDENPLPLP